MTSTTITLSEKQQNILYWVTVPQREALLYVHRNQIVGEEDGNVKALGKKGLAKLINEKPRRWSLTDEAKLLAEYLQTNMNVSCCDDNPLAYLMPLCWALHEITDTKTLEEAHKIATEAL